MRLPPPQPRVVLAALLLLLQALGLGHLAFAPHTLGERGELVDVAAQAGEVHHEQRSHLCSGDATVRADAHDCLVVAGWSTPSLLGSRGGVRLALRPAAPGFATSSVVTVPIDALTRAPKASPPQG